MADRADFTVNWGRRVQLPGELLSQGGIELNFDVTNSGDVTWLGSTHYFGARILPPERSLVFGQKMQGINLPASTAPAATLSGRTLKIFGAPRTPGVTIADIFHPDTLIILDLVGPSGWVGDPIGSLYVRDANGPP